MRDTQRGVAKVDPLYKFKFSEYTEKKRGTLRGTETKRREKCFTRALGRSRKSGDCKRMWHKEWELEYLEVTTAKMQYPAYRNDCSLDYQFLNSNKRPDIFFHQLSKVPEYSQFEVSYSYDVSVLTQWNVNGAFQI